MPFGKKNLVCRDQVNRNACKAFALTRVYILDSGVADKICYYPSDFNGVVWH